MYTKKKYTKRSTTTYRKGSTKRKSSKKNYVSFANKVKKALRKAAETKHYIVSLSQAGVDQRLGASTQHAIQFNPAQGVDQNQRVGNSVYVSGVKVTGVMHVSSAAQHPHLLKFMLYRLKSSKSMAVAPTDAQLDRMVQLGSSATHLGDQLLNLLRPLNIDLFKFFKVKTIKLGTSTASQPNNDYPVTYTFKW